MNLVCTGRNGSIGSSFPVSVAGLRTRLASSEQQMCEELVRLRATQMMHLAALTSVQECERNPKLAFELNVEGSVKWLRAAAAARLDHFIFISSAHVFQPTDQPVMLDPAQTGDAVSVYGRTKIEAEARLRLEADKLGVRLCIARVFSVVAPHSRSLRAGYLQSGLQRRARERDFSPLPGYKNWRDFIDTEQICQRLLQLSAAQDTGVHHICTGRPRTVRELAIEEMMALGLKEGEFASMFPDDDSRANYMISKPS